MSEKNLVGVAPQTWAFVSRQGILEHNEIGGAISKAFEELTERIARGGVRTRGAPRACYHYRDGGRIGFDLGFPIQPHDVAAAQRAGLKTGHTLSGEALVMVHHGPYEALAQAHRALEQELQARGLTGGGEVWEIYMNDPDDTPPAELLTEIYWPIERSEPS